MSEHQEALRPVIRYLEEHGDLDDGLTAKKVWDRGVVVADPGRPGWIVFEVERHTGILGTYYTPGMPMEAFVRY